MSTVLEHVATERSLTHHERVEAFEQVVQSVRAQCHVLINNELWAAYDEAKRCLFSLERMLAVFKIIEVEEAQLPRVITRGGRRVGLDLVPGSVAKARREANLSLRLLAAGQLTATAVHLIERGKCRPTLRTLRLIAEQTGKPLEYFIADTPWNKYIAAIGEQHPT